MNEEYGHISDAFDMLPEEELLMTEQQQALYGDVFLDKDTNVLYVFNGNKWLEIVPSLKEQALEEVGVFESMGTCNIDIIRRALEILPDD